VAFLLPAPVHAERNDAGEAATKTGLAGNGAVEGFICIGAFLMERGGLIRQTGSFVCQRQPVIRQFLFARVDLRIRGRILF
jgi:hypothetical protein